jgi:nitrogenase molybdenum-iron protein alpha/beta subunit
VEEILGRLGVLRRNQWCVEVGSPDGIPIPITLELADEHEMNVLAILTHLDDEKDFELVKDRKNVFVKKIDTIDDMDVIISENKLPEDITVLAVDTNGLEYDLWKRMEKYRPFVVVMPTDPTIPPGEIQHASEGVYASFTVMNELAASKGYTLVAHTGSVVYVRNDLLKELGIKGINLRNIDMLFDWSFINRA